MDGGIKEKGMEGKTNRAGGLDVCQAAWTHSGLISPSLSPFTPPLLWPRNHDLTNTASSCRPSLDDTIAKNTLRPTRSECI